MKKSIIIGAVSLLAVGAAQAAVITWGDGVGFSADTDVSNLGTTVLVVNGGGSAPVTINGVTFQDTGGTGSSLGGYLGTWLHQYLLSLQHGQPVRLVIVNPVALDETVLDCHLFDAFIGPQFNVYTGERWELTQNHCDQLKKLNVETLNCTDSIFLLAQAGDEILNYRLAEQKYKNCRLLVQQGGDHSFVDYHKALPDIFAFLTDQAS